MFTMAMDQDSPEPELSCLVTCTLTEVMEMTISMTISLLDMASQLCFLHAVLLHHYTVLLVFRIGKVMTPHQLFLSLKHLPHRGYFVVHKCMTSLAVWFLQWLNWLSSHLNPTLCASPWLRIARSRNLTMGWNSTPPKFLTFFNENFCLVGALH